MNLNHQSWCKWLFGNHSDAARRVSGEYTLHRVAEGEYGRDAFGRWFAVRLDDGSSDHVLYDSKHDAIRHQHGNEQQYAYIRVGPHSMTECDAEMFLATHRKMYDKGLRMVDPGSRNGGREVIKRLTVEDQRSLTRGIVTGLILPNRRD